MVEVIERIPEHYDVQEAAQRLCRTYRWCPEYVVLECDCGKREMYKRTDILASNVPPCNECGAQDMSRIREVLTLDLIDEDYEAHHYTWRYWHPSGGSGIPF